jgi:uncharacterized protein (UPF0335 family)
MRLIYLISKKNRHATPGLGVTTAGLRHSIRAIRDPRPPFFGPCPSPGRGFIIPFKKDPDFAVHNEAAVAPVREVLCTLISNLESLEMERADIVREISDNLVIARAKGFNIGAIRKILAERRRDKGELEEERAVIELYKSFLGM